MNCVRKALLALMVPTSMALALAQAGAQNLVVSRTITGIENRSDTFFPYSYQHMWVRFDTSPFTADLADYTSFTLRLAAPSGERVVVDDVAQYFGLQAEFHQSGNGEIQTPAGVTLSYENLTGSPLVGSEGRVFFASDGSGRQFGFNLYGSVSRGLAFTAVDVNFAIPSGLPSVDRTFTINADAVLAFNRINPPDHTAFVRLEPIASTNSVPEPGALALLAGCTIGAGVCVRGRRKQV